MSCRRLAVSFLCFLYLHSTVAFTLTRNTTHILQDVLKDIAKKQSWDWDGIRISRLAASKFRLGTSRRYEFRIRLGKSYLLFKFPDDEVGSWNTSQFDRRTAGDDDGGGLRDLIKEVGSVPLLPTLKLDGPFVLSAVGSGRLSLSLPMNTSFVDLKHVVVGEGMTVEVAEAEEVSLFHNFDLRLAVNETRRSKVKNGFRDFFDSLCAPLVPIRIVGSASLVAYKTKNNPKNSIVDAVSTSKNTIELRPEKCYTSTSTSTNNARSMLNRATPFRSLDSRIAKLESILSTYLGERVQNDGLWGFMRATIKASSMIRFQLELEKDPEKNNETTHRVEWRTRPKVERLWFEVTARIEDEKLKPVSVKKVRPFVAVDTASWSNLMSNVSFTKFPSILVPPEALTLDVKW